MSVGVFCNYWSYSEIVFEGMDRYEKLFNLKPLDIIFEALSKIVI